MKYIIQTIKEKYYTYQPNEFIPIYIDGKLANKRQFHLYRMKWIAQHRRAAVYQFTHYTS